MLSRIISEIEAGTVYSDRLPEIGMRVPQELTPFFKAAAEPIPIKALGLSFSISPVIPEEISSNKGFCSGTTINNRYISIGIEEADDVYIIALDSGEKEYPVKLIFCENNAETDSFQVEETDVIAPSFISFLKCLDAVDRAYTIPLYKTLPRSEHADLLRIALETELKADIRQTWWVERLSIGGDDFYWNQFMGPDTGVRFKEIVKEEIDRDEALFSLFSIIDHKRLKALKYFTVVEDETAVPVLFDILSTENEDGFIEDLQTSILNCRCKAVRFLSAAAASHPSETGRNKARSLLTSLGMPEGDIPEGADNTSVTPSIYPVEWPPFQEDFLIGFKYIGFLFILLASVGIGALFYLFTGSILSMAFGAAAVFTASMFLPDLGEIIMKFQLSSSDYGERFVDLERMKTEAMQENIAQSVEYSKKQISTPCGYLFYLKSDLEQKEYRPLILLQHTDQIRELITEWYQTGVIPWDGLRSKEVKEFWKSL